MRAITWRAAGLRQGNAVTGDWQPSIAMPRANERDVVAAPQWMIWVQRLGVEHIKRGVGKSGTCRELL